MDFYLRIKTTSENKINPVSEQMRYTMAEAETRHHYGAAGIWPHAMETLSKYNWLLVEHMIEPCSRDRKTWMDWLVGMKIIQMEFVFAEIMRKPGYMHVKYDKISMKVAARIAYQESRNGNLERERVMRFVRENSERHKKKEWWLIGRDIDDGTVFELVDLRERERNVTDLGLTLIRPLPKPHSTNSSTIHFSHIAWNQVGQAYNASFKSLVSQQHVHN